MPSTTGSRYNNNVLPPNPESVAQFHELSIPTREIKRAQATIKTACLNCNNSQSEKLVCAKCKIAAYCSRECQKTDWPSHKPVCKASLATAKLKFVHTFMANPYIEHLIMMAFIRTFNLHEVMILDRPLIVRCDLAVDPVDMSLILRLMSGELWPFMFPKGVEGMIQIKSFEPLDSKVAIDDKRMEMWEEAKARPSQREWGPHNTTGLIDFHMEGTDQVVTLPINIHDPAVECARIEDFGMMEDATGTRMIEIPMTPHYCLCAINVHIRDDVKNQCRLRPQMSKDELHKYYRHNRFKLHRSHFGMLPMTFTEWEFCVGPPFLRTVSRPWLIIPHLVRVSQTEVKTELRDYSSAPVYQLPDTKGKKITDPDEIIDNKDEA